LDQGGQGCDKNGPGSHAIPFAANAARLQLLALAYNLGNFMRMLAMIPRSLTSLREKLIRAAGVDPLHCSFCFADFSWMMWHNTAGSELTNQARNRRHREISAS